jgi:hypothetical protein
MKFFKSISLKMKSKKLFGVLFLCYIAVISGCISIHKHRYTKGFHLSKHGNANEAKQRTNRSTINLQSKEKQGHTLPNYSCPAEPTRFVQDAPKLQIDSVKPTGTLRARASVHAATASVKRIAKKNPTQNILEQKKSSTQNKAQADLLYVLALIAMVLLILLLLKNFPLLSLLLFIIALLLVLRYFDII